MTNVANAPVNCPLCMRSEYDLLSTIAYEDIRALYRRQLNMEIPASQEPTVRFLKCRACDLRFFDPMTCGDAGFYERLQEFPWYYLADKAEYHIASRFAPATGDVLEIGCGAGKFRDFLPEGIRYRGLEFNQEAIRKARERGLNVEKQTVEELAVREGPVFDMICSFQVLEHVPAPGDLLDAAIQLLKPTGLLVLAVPSEDSFMADLINNVLNTPPHHVTRWSDAALRNVASLKHLELVGLEHENLSPMHDASWAKTRMLRLMSKSLGIEVPMIKLAADSFPAKALFYVLRKPFELRIEAQRAKITGHSVVAVYRKPAA